MLVTLSYLFLATSLAYVFLVAFYVYHWIKHPTASTIDVSNDNWPTVSVIIPFRNEIVHLSHLVSDLKDQNYSGRFEVILVNDHSDDDFESHLLHLPENFALLKADADMTGKKAAMELGISASKAEFILFSDADTRRGVNWIKSMVSCAIEKNADMTTGPVLDEKVRQDWLSQYYRSELAAFLVVSAAAIQGRIHAMGNGANMLVKKSKLPSEDPFGKSKSESGDDLFLAEYFFEKGTLTFCKSKEAVITTYPPASEGELIHQKIRWAGKNKMLRSGAIRPAMIITAAMPLIILSTPLFAMFYGTSLLWIGLGMFLIKTAAEHVLINQGMIWNNEAISWEISIRQQLTNLVITSRTLLALFLGQRARWKGRKI